MWDSNKTLYHFYLDDIRTREVQENLLEGLDGKASQVRRRHRHGLGICATGVVVVSDQPTGADDRHTKTSVERLGSPENLQNWTCHSKVDRLVMAVGA